MEIPYPSLIFFRVNVLQMSLTKDFRSFAKLWLPQNSISDDIGENSPFFLFRISSVFIPLCGSKLNDQKTPSSTFFCLCGFGSEHGN